MEQVRISSTPGAQAQQTMRGRKANDAENAGAPNGFLALLSILDDAALQAGNPGGVMGEAAHAGTDAEDIAADDLAKSVDVSAVVTWQGLMAADAGGPQQLSPREKGDWVGGVGLGGKGVLNAGNGSQQGLVAETALLDGAVDQKDSVLQGPVAGYGRIFARMQGALAQRSIAGGGGFSDAHEERMGAGQMASLPAAGVQALANGSQGMHLHINPNAALAGQTVSEKLERAVGLTPATTSLETSLSGAGGLMPASVAARSGDTTGDGRSGESQPGGAWVDGAAPLETGGLNGQSGFADPAQAVAEEFVADQVAYWVNQKTQTAELTLSRDGQPVEVSVSLSGNEAHVTFRSDQSETRDLLDRSMAQLSDLLRSEGLVLSGVSVGTSARDGADDARQRRSHDGTRHAQVVSSAPADAATAPRRGAITERTVDIFV